MKKLIVRGNFMKRIVTLGVSMAIVAIFPVAALTALVYRFPIPFCEYASGLSAVPMSFLAVLFYGMLGGFPALGIIGGLCGFVIASISIRRKWTDLSTHLYLTVSILIIDIMASTLLATLDKIIGPW
jgi:hypothetical protein